MSLDRTSEANDYLKAHRIPELMENLTSQLIYQQPGKIVTDELRKKGKTVLSDFKLNKLRNKF